MFLLFVGVLLRLRLEFFDLVVLLERAVLLPSLSSSVTGSTGSIVSISFFMTLSYLLFIFTSAVPLRFLRPAIVLLVGFSSTLVVEVVFSIVFFLPLSFFSSSLACSTGFKSIGEGEFGALCFSADALNFSIDYL